MPNHCTNLLICTSGKTIGELVKPYISERTDRQGVERFLDFNKIVPMPPCIEESSKFGDIDYITSKRTPEEEAIEKQKQDENKQTCVDETGFSGWYEWCKAKWDTKWNSYSNLTLEDSSNEIEDLSSYCFQTAWCPPTNVIRELAKITGETIEMYYYDEGHMFFGCTTFSKDSENDECYEAEEAADIDPESDIYKYCDLDYYFEMHEDDDEE